MRVIGADGSQVGIMPTYEAMKMAEEQGLELVEVNPRAAPPVCRIMDFGKFKYETSKKEKASRKHQSTVVVKEIKFRPKTDDHDLDFKVKHIRRFLAEGNKCRLVIVFRGREIVHPETGQAMLDAVINGPWATPPWSSRRPRWKAGAWCSPWDPAPDWSVLLVRSLPLLVPAPRLVAQGGGCCGWSGGWWRRWVRGQPGRGLRTRRVRSPGGSRGPDRAVPNQRA